MIFLLVSFFLLSSMSAAAHDGGAVPSDVWTHWNLSPLMLICLLVPAGLYIRGALTYRVEPRRTALFIAGLLMLAVAFISPIDALSSTLFSAHMVQHLVLVIAAAPLLVWSAPGPPMLRGVPRRWRRPVGLFLVHPSAQALWRQFARPLPAFGLHVAAMLLWHAPPLYDAALVSPLLHTLEHASFFVSAALFWWTVAYSEQFGARVLSVFGVMMVSGGLGALMTFSQSVWYGGHTAYVAAWGLTGLQDQQLAGMLMWVPAGALYVAAVAGLIGDWLDRMDRRPDRTSSGDAGSQMRVNDA